MKFVSQQEGSPGSEIIPKAAISGKKSGVGNGNRTRNRWSHSPVLCQLSYSHHSF